MTSTYMIETIWRPVIPTIPDGLRLNGWSRPDLWFYMFSLLFLACTTYKVGPLNYFFRIWFFRHIGLLSYSIYIIHMNIQFSLMGKGLSPETLFLTVFFLAYLYSFASYVVIEKPFLGIKKSKIFWFNR